MTDSVRCPTCRAEQPCSDTCRRCRSDLRLLREFLEASERNRAMCLRHLSAGRTREALDEARIGLRLRPDPAAWRLLAVCAAACEDWPTALAASARCEEP